MQMFITLKHIFSFGTTILIDILHSYTPFRYMHFNLQYSVLARIIRHSVLQLFEFFFDLSQDLPPISVSSLCYLYLDFIFFFEVWNVELRSY